MMTYGMRRVLAGWIAAAAALAVGQLLAAGVGRDSAPFYAVGSAIVDRTPSGVREWVITNFGTDDKAFLFACLAVVVAVLSAVAGVVEQGSRPIGSAIIVGFAVFGAVAAMSRPTSTGAFVWPSLVGGVVGVLVLRLLLGYRPAAGFVEPGDTDVGRRRFFAAAAVLAVGSVGVYALGRKLVDRSAELAADRRSLRLPVPQSAAPPIPPDVNVRGAVPYITDNGDFYRIDTALQVPQLTTGEWRLKIHGMVDRPRTITWNDLVSMAAVQRAVTLTCVSNEVGGDLIGNAVWTGIPIKPILDSVGVQPGADMLLSRSVDGWTAGTPISVLTDGRDAILAVAMNGQPLPTAHGYPVRQVVPGLYGYVSATKWVTDWEITRFDKATAYWTDRGWSALGPIKTGCRIDSPSSGARIGTGTQVIAGTAWAQHRGIKTVEVQIDNGPWQTANLAPEYSIDTWRQWWLPWQAEKGTHTITARATDGTGVTQTSETADPVPDGATGYPKKVVRVDGSG